MTPGGNLGAALGPDRLVATLSDGAVWTRPIDQPLDEAVLEAALRELRQAAGGRTLHLALLPSLAQVRRLEFPRLREAELLSVLRRDAKRHFAAARGPQAVAVRVLGSAVKGRMSVLASAAPEWLIEALWAAAPRAGWSLQTICPAQGAWTAAARALWPRRVTDDGRLVLAADGRVESLEFWRGELAGVRRFLLTPELEEVDVDGATALAGSPAWRDQAAVALLARGALLAEPKWVGAGDDVDALAAAWAHTGAPALVPPRAAAGQAARAARATWVLVGCAIALLAAAASLDTWGARRELDAVRAERARIEPAVAEVDSVRRTLDALNLRFATLRALEAGAPAWPVVLASVAETLPADAHLTAFRAEGDSVVMEGEARRASRVVEALQRTPGLAGVRLAAPVRRELAASGGPVERFVVRARLGAGEAGVGPFTAAGGDTEPPLSEDAP